MKTRCAWLAASLTLALLGGCAQMRDGPRVTTSVDAFKVDPKVHNIAVVDGVIVLQQDPMVFAKGQSGQIAWNLDPKSGYSFDGARGIQFVDNPGEEIVDCKAIANGKSFTCNNRHTKPGKYRYTINLLLDGKPVKPVDPTVNNM